MKAKPIEHWKETIEWINQSWQKKKGRPYPFMPSDFKCLERLRRFYTAPEVLALWDRYLAASPYYGSRTGYLISGFWMERSVLLEDSHFKSLVKFHQERIEPTDAQRMAVVKSMIGQMLAGKDISK